MALLRKKNPEWKPSEDKGLEVGDTIEVSDYRRLVELGDADLVDDKGNVLPLPGTVFVCGICYEKVGSHSLYVEHIMREHASQTTINKEDVVIEDEADEPEAAATESKQEVTESGIKVPNSFGERMAKARAEAKAKRQVAKKTATS